jgi:succinate dehydrogenase / fumarate reductase membrane anchor subunit
MVGKDDSFKTDLKRARGYGSAHHGSGVWLAERVTSVALVPLGLWAIYSVLQLAIVGYDGAVDFFRSPVNVTLALLTLGISFHHMHMGMRVILEDYIEHKPSRLLWIGLSAAASLLGAGLAIISLLKVAFTGDAG